MVRRDVVLRKQAGRESTGGSKNLQETLAYRHRPTAYNQRMKTRLRPAERNGRSARGLRPAPLSAFHHRSLSGAQSALLLPCVPAPWSLGELLGASISDLFAIGGGSHFGLGWGWTLLVYCRQLCGLYSCIVE